MSEDIVWDIVKNRSAFLVKRNGLVFSSEEMNLMNKNSKKFSALANTRAFGIAQGEKGKVDLVLKSGRRTSTQSRNVNQVHKSVRNLRSLRPDLMKAAAVRMKRISGLVVNAPVKEEE